MLRNSVTSYGSVAKWLLWLTAALVVTAYLIIESFHWIFGGEGSMRSPLISSHKAVGFSVLVHVSAALYHHAVLKDEVLTRMLPGKR